MACGDHGGCAATCPVCQEAGARRFITVAGRDYWRCGQCRATFLDARQLPDADTERRQYELHENDPSDPRYRAFLARLSEPLLARIAPASCGLDYGCGPGPALAQMLAEAGHAMSVFDPLFFPDAAVLQRTYDFITCSEVVEHFHRPAREFQRFDALLRPGGWLGVMTCFQTDDSRFADWHYRRDPTHVVFYRRETFHYLAARLGWHCELPADNVVLMRKPPAGPN